MSEAARQHKSFAPKSVTCYVLTVSDTRTAETDTSGRAIRSGLPSGARLLKSVVGGRESGVDPDS